LEVLATPTDLTALVAAVQAKLASTARDDEGR